MCIFTDLLPSTGTSTRAGQKDGLVPRVDFDLVMGTWNGKFRIS